MRTVVVVVVLPLLQLVGEQVGVVDDLAGEEPVELFGVDPVGSLHLAVEAWCAGFDTDVVDAEVESEIAAVLCCCTYSLKALVEI
jgi:hypothetical protein